MGGDDDGELYSSPGLYRPDNSSSQNGSNKHDVIEDSNSNPKKRKKEVVCIEHQSAMVRPRWNTVPIKRLSAEENKINHSQAHMITALAAAAAAAASGDMSSMLAVDQIQKKSTATPTAEYLRRLVYTPANR
jgi:hypothetical protein